MKTAAIYARYSCENQTEQSIEGQLRVCQEYAASLGILIVETYIDRAMSGMNDNRAAFQQMLKDSSKKQFQYVIVYKLDRFARNKVESVINKKTLQDNGVSLLSAMERITDTPEGHMMETILEGFNQYFSEELAQKVKRGMRETRLKGLYQGGGVPYGYKVEGRKVVIDESAAEIVRYAFQEYSKGAFVLEIIDTLHKKGLLYKGKPFPRNLLYHVLRNEKYTGSYKCRDEVVDNIYPQIIPVELFQKVGARLEKNRYGKRSFEATYLLKFKAKCGYCGMPMYSETGTASNGETNRYYKCAGKKKYHNGCTKSQVRKEYLEDIVVNAIIDELNRPGAIEFITKKLLETQEENIKNNSTVNALLKEKTKIDKQLENIANAIQNGIVSKTTAKRLQDLEEQQEKLEREILIEQSKQATPLTRSQIKEFYSDALEMEPRMLIEYLVKEVIMYDDKIQIIFKSPINTVPDEDRGFLLSANFCKPKKVISSRSSSKRKIMVEIGVE